MSQPSTYSSARRSLAQRIDRFLRTHVPTDWQTDQVLVAIEMLDAECFGEGERIMMYVEKPHVWGPVEYISDAPKDARQLLELLERAVAA